MFALNEPSWSEICCLSFLSCGFWGWNDEKITLNLETSLWRQSVRRCWSWSLLCFKFMTNCLYVADLVWLPEERHTVVLKGCRWPTAGSARRQNMLSQGPGFSHSIIPPLPAWIRMNPFVHQLLTYQTRQHVSNLQFQWLCVNISLGFLLLAVRSSAAVARLLQGPTWCYAFRDGAGSSDLTSDINKRAWRTLGGAN